MPFNNINYSLRVTNLVGATIYNIALEDQTSDLDIKASKILNTIVNGSYTTGIKQGISAIEAGSKVSFSLPIFFTTDDGVQDITEFWKTILNNSRVYKFYLLRNQDSFEYKREMIPIDNLGYKSNFFTNAGSSKLNFQFLDNFYIGEEITTPIAGFTASSGVLTDSFMSATKVGTQTRFEIEVQNLESIFYEFSFYSVGGTGISFSRSIPINSTIRYDGVNMYLSGQGSDEIVVFFTGSSPDLVLGTTLLVFNTSIKVDSFELSYNPRTDF